MRDVTEQEVDRAIIGEIHHRVKNNLQVLISLFSLQAERTTDPQVRKIVGELQNRVRVIANLHEPLYSLDNFSAIHFGEYLNNLARELESFYGLGRRVRLQLSLADLALDSDDAVALALIGNELLSNAFQHAFGEGRSGNISLALRYDSRRTQNREAQFGEMSVERRWYGTASGNRFRDRRFHGFSCGPSVDPAIAGKRRGGDSRRHALPHLLSVDEGKP